MENNKITRHGYHPEIFDPFQASVDCLLVIAFPKSNSPNYPLAVGLAEGGERYAVVPINGKPMNVAALGKTQTEAGRALALIEYVQGWKGTLMFSRGRLIKNSYQLSSVINCFIDSCLCRDKKAFCYTIIDDPLSENVQDIGMSISIRIVEKPPIKQAVQIDRYAFPCKLLFQRFKFQKGHPSTPQDQVQAAGVEFSCNVCPNFEPDDFKKIGVRTAVKDF